MSSSQARTSRHNQAFWQEHTDQWKLSGLSKIAYCQRHNLKPASFYNWSKKLEHTGSTLQLHADTQTSFVPVQVDHRVQAVRHNAEFVHVERAATDIALPVDLTSEQIQHWLQAIHTLHV